jgi:hypothetical protein
MGIGDACRAVGISRATWYRWTDGDGSKSRAQRDEASDGVNPPPIGSATADGH